MKITHISFLIAGVCALATPLSAGPGCGSGCSYSGVKQAAYTPAKSECADKKASMAYKSECEGKGSISGQWSSNSKDATLTLWTNGTFLLSQKGEFTTGQYTVEKDELVLKTESASTKGEWVSHRYKFSEKPDSLTLSASSKDSKHVGAQFAGVWSYQNEAPERKG